MKKTKFKALKRKIWIPDNCHYFDLGESTDFYETVKSNLEKRFPKEVIERFEKHWSSNPNFRTRDGWCHQLALKYTDDSIEKYTSVVYRPRKSGRWERLIDTLGEYWYSRGHEEGHSLIFFGLEDEIDKIVGGEVDHSDEEAVCALCGFHAMRIRGREDKLSHRLRCYYERARK